MTKPNQFVQIMEDRALKVKPDIPNEQRWMASQGPDNYPFVRWIGGVSLFDFANFDPESYDQTYPASTWRRFIPHPRNWSEAVWIEIDYEALGDRYISAGDLVLRWKKGQHHRHTIMPHIECACIGDVPALAFRSAFSTWSNGDKIQDISIAPFNITEFRALLEGDRRT